MRSSGAPQTAQAWSDEFSTQGGDKDILLDYYAQKSYMSGEFQVDKMWSLTKLLLWFIDFNNNIKLF